MPTGEVRARVIVRRCIPGQGMGVQFLNMTPEDHNGLSPAAFVMVKIQNGGFQLVD